jgi:hypothetical protein
LTHYPDAGRLEDRRFDEVKFGSDEMKLAASDETPGLHRVGRRAAREHRIGKGKISPEAFASLKTHPGKPIFREKGVAGSDGRFFAISPELQLCLPRIAQSMSTGVVFHTRCDTRLRAYEASHARCNARLLHHSSTLNERTFCL